MKPVGTGAQLLHVLLEEHDINAAGERLGGNLSIESKAELQRPRLRQGGNRRQNKQHRRKSHKKITNRRGHHEKFQEVRGQKNGGSYCSSPNRTATDESFTWFCHYIKTSGVASE